MSAQGFFDEEPDNRAGMVNTTTVTINTTVTQAITVTFQWGTASAGDTITCTNLIVEAIG